ncbi:MAG: ATP-binding domain-containing protein [Chloroflexi bacterium]|nr:ATP-binding domain-containing protein [Chloroflexota bacterium]
MADLIVTLPTYEDDNSAHKVWEILEKQFENQDGKCYYKHPVIKTDTGITPDFTLFVRTNQPLVIRCLSYQLSDITSVGGTVWDVVGRPIESPILELEDFVVLLQAKFDKERQLRHRFKVRAVLAFPLISQREFESKFNKFPEDIAVIWKGGSSAVLISPITPELTDPEWRYAKAVLQSATPLNKPSTIFPNSNADLLGTAIPYLDREIAYLDDEQEKVAIQIPPGPQRIRGLAGTGKTVLLAMKAANIHHHYPNKKILFTFNTQSLYNQAKTLISKFYRVYSDTDPDWDRLHIRHAWGGQIRSGVYYDLCARQGTQPLDLVTARNINSNSPFQACCESALKLSIAPEYDFILLDEAQDFPKEFFQLLYKLSFPPKQLYWAYDELQNLSSIEMPKLGDQFGLDSKKNPLVSLDGTYPGGIAKDFVLHRSYRCPQSLLMLAHAIGLGLYRPKGCIQMLENKGSWEALGYKVEVGELRKGEKTIISRSPENSPNPISRIYTGLQEFIVVKHFQNREEELDWIADSIRKDIKEELVVPEQIVVIALDAPRARQHLVGIQQRLVNYSIASTIPGIYDSQASYAELGKVTLSTVFRAKGNEAYIVYIFSFESLYDYVEEIGNRNRAFTAITRAKAWVRITGIGKKMEEVNKEIDQIRNKLPKFEFIFPDINNIRRLDAETMRKRGKVAKAKDIASEFKKLDKDTIAALGPEMLESLAKLVKEAQSEG